MPSIFLNATNVAAPEAIAAVLPNIVSTLSGLNLSTSPLEHKPAKGPVDIQGGHQLGDKAQQNRHLKIALMAFSLAS